jgi:toxin ParE1/3/4
MAKYQVRFHVKAIEEAERSKGWYELRSPTAALGFLNELSHAVEMVSENPNRWPSFHSGTRRYVFPRYPFSLIYRLNEDIEEVIAIAHHKKRPDYWSKR